MSQNSSKKCHKKQLRCQHIVRNETAITFTEYPTCNLVICNAGLSTGLSEDVIVDRFAIHGELKSIQMVIAKSYCYITYKNLQDAENAYKAYNGQLNIAQNNKPIYLGYAVKVPNLPSSLTFLKPPGLRVIENIISENEESVFIELVQNQALNEETQSLKHRFVKHYGFEFNYDINNINRNSPLDEMIPLECEKLFPHMGFTPDQLTVNVYDPGHGIPPHVDTHSAFEDIIVSLSLGSDIVMDFRHDDGRHYSVVLPRRSLTIMSGESRYDWTHGITPRKLDIIHGLKGMTVKRRQQRISYTFRKVNFNGECTCSFLSKCDTKLRKEIKDAEARTLEDQYVQQVYNTIASHFSETRHKPWPKVQAFVTSFEVGSVILDVGCGNGKNIGHNTNSFEVGCDNSNGLLNLCRERSLEVFTCNCLMIPFKDSTADGIISIAVIHHLATQSRRQQAVNELIRVLRLGGKGLIYVWAKNQNINDKSSYLKQDRKNRKNNSCIDDNVTQVDIGLNVSLPVHTNRKQFAEQDMLVPWKMKGSSEVSVRNTSEYLRFYHVFQENELKDLVESSNNVKILNYYYDQGNWCIIFEKIK